MSKFWTEKEIDNTTTTTVIGSMRFEPTMKQIAEELQSFGILSLMSLVGSNCELNISEDYLMKEGYKRIALSDNVVCVNNNGYIGENTSREIDYAYFIRRIPVFFKFNKVSEKMLKYINVFFKLKSGSYTLLQTYRMEGFDTKDVTDVYIRENCSCHEDILSMLKIEDGDTELLSSLLMVDTKAYLPRDNSVSYHVLNDTDFEDIIIESELYYNDLSDVVARK